MQVNKKQGGKIMRAKWVFTAIVAFLLMSAIVEGDSWYEEGMGVNVFPECHYCPIQPRGCHCFLLQDHYPGNFPTYEAWLKTMRNSLSFIGEDANYIYLKAASSDGRTNFYEDSQGNTIMSLDKRAIQKKYWG